jgi:hypothetical protein
VINTAVIETRAGILRGKALSQEHESDKKPSCGESLLIPKFDGVAKFGNSRLEG